MPPPHTHTVPPPNAKPEEPWCIKRLFSTSTRLSSPITIHFLSIYHHRSHPPPAKRHHLCGHRFRRAARTGGVPWKTEHYWMKCGKCCCWGKLTPPPIIPALHLLPCLQPGYRLHWRIEAGLPSHISICLPLGVGGCSQRQYVAVTFDQYYRDGPGFFMLFFF